MENEQTEPTPSIGRVYTVFGPRGGSGKTTIAVNLAVVLAKMRPSQVCLVDLALTFGHCAMTLNAAPRPSLASTNADGVARWDPSTLERYLSEHSGTLKLMVGSNTPEEGDAVTAAHVAAIIGTLKQQFSIVIVDTSSHFSDAMIAALEGADRVLMVCTPELSTLRDVAVCKRIFSNVIHLPNEKVHYVMNNVFPFKSLAMEQFVENLEQAMDAEIPYGNDLPSKAATGGQPFVLTQSGAGISKAIEKLGRTIEAEVFPQQTEKRGLFSRR